MKQPRGQGHRKEIQCNMHEQQAIIYATLLCFSIGGCGFEDALSDEVGSSVSETPHLTCWLLCVHRCREAALAENDASHRWQ